MGALYRPAVGDGAPRKAPPAPRKSGLTDVGAERVPDYQDKLTFYQTLTAPLGATPPPAKPDPHARTAAPARVSPATPRASEPAVARPLPESRPAVRPPSTEAAEWTVQVGVFKSAGQAEAVKKRLARGTLRRPDHHRGAAEDGQPRYRVRVGAFKSKDDAARTAERVRSDLSLSTFVTTR